MVFSNPPSRDYLSCKEPQARVEACTSLQQSQNYEIALNNTSNIFPSLLQDSSTFSISKPKMRLANTPMVISPSQLPKSQLDACNIMIYGQSTKGVAFGEFVKVGISDCCNKCRERSTMSESIAMERIEADRNNQKGHHCGNPVGKKEILGVILIDIVSGKIVDIRGGCIMGTVKMLVVFKDTRVLQWMLGHEG